MIKSIFGTNWVYKFLQHVPITTCTLVMNARVRVRVTVRVRVRSWG